MECCFDRDGLALWSGKSFSGEVIAFIRAAAIIEKRSKGLEKFCAISNHASWNLMKEPVCLYSLGKQLVHHLQTRGEMLLKLIFSHMILELELLKKYYW